MRGFLFSYPFVICFSQSLASAGNKKTFFRSFSRSYNTFKWRNVCTTHKALCSILIDSNYIDAFCKQERNLRQCKAHAGLEKSEWPSQCECTLSESRNDE